MHAVETAELWTSRHNDVRSAAAATAPVNIWRGDMHAHGLIQDVMKTIVERCGKAQTSQCEVRGGSAELIAKTVSVP